MDGQEPGKGGEAQGRWARLGAGLHTGLQSYRRILAYVRPYWRSLAGAGLSLTVNSLLGLAMPLAMRSLVDHVLVGKDVGQLNRIALILGGIFGVQAALGVVHSYLIAWVGERVVASLRRQIYEHLLALPLRFFDNQRAGWLVSRLTSDVQIIQSAVTSNIIVLLQQAITAIGVLIIVSAMDWRLTALMVVALPGLVIVTRLMGRRMRRIARLVQDTLAAMAAVAYETISGIRIVQSFAREDHENDRFGGKVDTLLGASMERARIYAILGPITSLSIYGSLALVLWVGGMEVVQGRLTAGELISFLFYAAMLTGPLGSIAGLYSQVQTALGATERVFELLDTRSEIVDAPDAVPLPPITGHVVLNRVGFDYDPRQPVLRDIQMEARPGQVVALVGPSGVGKTTLVNLIPRFYDVTAGRIEIDGLDVRCLSLRSLRDQIGIVPQETLLFRDTIAANIRYGRLDATQDEIEAAARAANAHDFIVNELPDGYQSQVGERGVKLSGGQRQRIAIARAILKDPRILILDEATSSLDTQTERLVQEALERLMRPQGSGPGRTTFVIAHRLSTIVNADWIVVLDAGTIAEQGTHAELLAREGGLYRHYYSLQFRWEEDRPLAPSGEEALAIEQAEPWPGLPFPRLPGSLSADLDPDSPSRGDAGD